MILYLYFIQNAPVVRTVLTTAVTPVVHTVLVATVITLTGPVPMDVNQDTTLTIVSYAIQVCKHTIYNFLHKLFHIDFFADMIFQNVIL